MIKVAYINFWKQTSDIQDYWLSNFVKNNIGSSIVSPGESDDEIPHSGDDSGSDGGSGVAFGHATRPSGGAGGVDRGSGDEETPPYGGSIIHVKPNENPDILFCSCMGNIENVKKLKAKVKIFFYGENLERYEPYNNIELLKSTFDLIVGFKYTDLENKIIRLPLWLMYYNYYNMNDTNNNIITYLENKYKINSKINKSNFCSLIARHDRGGQRTLLLREMDKYGKVMCPSGFNHNCSSIRQGNESKIDFVKQCKYNICPENSKYEGYFTEKIFQAFECGCIPIYWAIDEPEKEILNKNKYCFVTNINDKNEVSEKIKDVIENPEKYLEGNIFNKDAYDTLDKYYNTFISEIKKRL